MLVTAFKRPPAQLSISLSLLVLLAVSSCGLAMSNDDRLDRADEAIKQGDYVAAIIDAKDVLLKEPDNLRGRLVLGRASLEVSDGAAAEKELRRALELGAPWSDVIVDLARSLVLQGKYRELIDEVETDSALPDEINLRLTQLRGDSYLGLNEATIARELFTSVLAVDPENVAAKLGIVSSYLSESNYIQSRSTLDEVLSAHPESVEAWLASGDLNMRLRRFLDAGSNFEKTLELLPDEGDTGLVLRGLNGLAESQLALGENDNARQTVARLVDLAPESIVALHLSARIAFLDEDWKTTQLNLQRVLQIAPNFEPAKMLLGMAHLNSGNLAKAEMYLSAAVANTPSNMEARMLLAETRAQLQRVDLVNETLRPMLSGQNKNPRALAIAGRASMESGDIDEGISYLEQSVAADPDSNQLKLLLAAAYISSDRQAEAKEILDTFDAGSATDDEYRREMLQAAALFKDGEVAAAIEVAQLVSGRWPEKGEIQNLLGTFYLTEQDLVNARRSFELGAQKSADQLPSLRFLAAIDRIEGHLDAARLRYLDVLEQKPGTVWALVALARIAIDSENVAEARKFLEEARSSDSTAVEPRVLLANMYLVEEDFRSAEVVAKEAIELNPNIASLHNTLGLAALNQRRFKEAAESFQTAVSMAEQNDDFRLNLARAQGALGDTASAEKTLETSLEREVADISSAGMLIALKVDEGKFDEALLLARNLQQMHPEEQAPLAFEGEVHINKGDLGEAIRVYERALALGPNRNIALRAHALIRREGSGDEFRPLLDYLDQRPLDSVARLILAQAYERDSQLDKAVQQYETVVEGEPDNAAALNNLAWNYSQTGDSRAESTARRAYELRPTEATIADTLGWILVQKDEAEEGVRILQEVVLQNGDQAEFKFHLAMGFAKLGRTEEARRVLEDILNNDDEFEGRKEAEALLDEL